MTCSGEHRMINRTAMILLALLTAIAPFAVTPSADAQEAAFDPAQMVFPVISEREPLSDSFDDCRSGCERTHEATDIMRPKMTPVVAAADGVVSWMGTVENGKCCYVFIDHPGGYKTGYIHLNNDTPGTDDGLGNGIAEGIVPGATVLQGQLIGWVGDSGNAEWAGSHLHFEIRYYGNGYEERINPYPYLLEAPILDAPLGEPVPEAQSEPFVGPTFSDDDGSPHEPDIERLVELGVTKGCSSIEYCPTDSITRGQMAAFVRRYLGLGAVEVADPAFHDIAGHIFEEDIEAIVAAGIGFGVDAEHYAPDEPLRREEMAKFLVLAFEIAAADGDAQSFDDIEPGSEFEPFILVIQSVEVTKGCSETEYCPTAPVTREQMASFFVRSIDLP